MDLREYLLKQKKLASDLNEVLLQLDSLSNDERNKILEENKDIIAENNKLDKENTNIVKDRIEELKLKVKALMNGEESKNNFEYYKYLNEKYNEIIKLEKKILELTKSLESTSVSSFEKVKDEEATTNINKETSSINRLEQDIKNQNDIIEAKKEDNYKKENKLEFKVGVNILSIVGVILILISFVTFGRYVYVNYMSDIVKGITLFLISSLILIAGEVVHRKLNSKFSIGIISLGIGTLYASVIINYLVLITINSIVALIITTCITSVSIVISSKHNSNIVRLIALIGGYCCLVPMNTLDTIQSITTVIILCLIGLFNILKPIKNEKSKISFNIYSIVLNLIVYTKVISQGFLDDSAMIIYSIVVCILVNIMFLREVKAKNKKSIYIKVGIVGLYIYFSSALTMIIDIDTNARIILFIIYLVVLSILFIKEKCKEWILYIQFVITVILIFSYIENYYMLTGAFIVLTLGSVFLLKKFNNIFIRISSYICIVCCIIDFFTGESYLETLIYRLIYVLVLGGAIYVLTLNNKNSKGVIVLKYVYVVLFMLFFDSINIVTSLINESIAMLCIGITFTIIINEVDILRHKNIETYNFVTLLLLEFINIITLLYFDLKMIQFIIIVVLGITIMMLIKKLYGKENIVTNNIYFICGIYLTLSIFKLRCLNIFSNIITSIITNVLLMILSFICIWGGFKLKVKKLRQYGLIISLLTCAKVVFIDSYISNFAMKTIVFLLIGCIALVISFVYSKIEKKSEI